MFFLLYGIDGVGKDAIAKGFPGLVVSNSRLIMYSAGIISSLHEKPRLEHYQAFEGFSPDEILTVRETRCREFVAGYDNVLLLDHLAVCYYIGDSIEYREGILTSWEQEADGFILLRATPEEVAERRRKDVAIKSRVQEFSEIKRQNELSFRFWQKLVDKVGASRTHEIWNRQGHLDTAIAEFRAILCGKS